MIQTLFGSVEQEPSLLDRLKSGVQKTRAGLVNARSKTRLQGKKEIDADLLDELEYTLVSRRHRGAHHQRNPGPHPRARGTAPTGRRRRELKSLIREHLLEILQASERADAAGERSRPP